jgi:hypothetical protein
VQDTRPVAVPSDAALLAFLGPALARDGGGELHLVAREDGEGGTHPRELVAIGWPDGRVTRVLLKYELEAATMPPGGVPLSPRGAPAPPCGARGGVRYEAQVYAGVLARVDAAVPRCYGAWTDEASGVTAIAVEYVDDDGSRRGLSYEQRAAAAAGWLGRAQASADALLGAGWQPPLLGRPAEHWTCWAQRAVAFERRTRAWRAWLPTLLERLPRVLDLLDAAAPTLVHGDFYPDNMVYVGGVARVFDWEDAALGAGELDLATLTYDWHDEVVQAAEAAYVAARWPSGAPAAFPDTIEGARVLVGLRLLGEAPGWPDRSERRHRVELLRQSALRLGLL